MVWEIQISKESRLQCPTWAAADVLRLAPHGAPVPAWRSNKTIGAFWVMTCPGLLKNPAKRTSHGDRRMFYMSKWKTSDGKTCDQDTNQVFSSFSFCFSSQSHRRKRASPGLCLVSCLCCTSWLAQLQDKLPKLEVLQYLEALTVKNICSPIENVFLPVVFYLFLWLTRR